MSVHFKEVEFKYSADKIKLKDFKHVAGKLKPIKFIEAAGFDYYFVKNRKSKRAWRYRAGDLHELTLKTQTDATNNYIREETNIRIVPKETNEETLNLVKSFVGQEGYKLNFSIFKTCFIYYYQKFDLVYYIVSDENMNEVNRFLEIEMLEDYPWQSIEEVWNELLLVEKQLSALGIRPKRRIPRSLFQLYRK